MIIYVIILVILLLLLWKYKYIEPSEKTEKEKLLDGLLYVHNLFKKNKLWYCISFGTLLGAVRHHGMIPWDDDIDLFVLRKEIDKFEKLIPKIKKDGYKVVKEWKLYKIYVSEKSFIDLFIIDFQDNKVIRCITNGSKCITNSKRSRWWWKWFNFDKEYISPLKKYYFNGLHVWGPGSPANLLEFWYEKNVLTECKTHDLDHQTGKFIKPKIISCGRLPKPQL